MAGFTDLDAIRADLNRGRLALLAELEDEQRRAPLPPCQPIDRDAAGRARQLRQEVAAFYEQRKTSTCRTAAA